jgi:hypothetical protein
LSRNKERVGGVQQHDSAPPPQTTHEERGDVFSFVVPTEFVDLPSQGRFYSEGHPLHGEDSIEIRHMTAKEEDMLTSRTLLKKGVALDRVIQSIIVDKRINADTLLAGDRNAIVIAARISGYGNVYETQVTCPSCGEQQKYTFDLNLAHVFHGKTDLEELNVTDNQNGTYDAVLPRMGLTVTLKMLTGKDEKSLISGAEQDRKKKAVEKSITRQLSRVIIAVGGDSSPEALKFLIECLPSIDARHLRFVYRQISPNIDLEQHFERSECDFEQDMEVPLTADFFWPDR